ncbi:superoxide dismutase [Micromonospora sp. WMMD714]|uniref:SMP-30/gluconolactonase/LRE family protein n=1 Tax=Micromonospora sp. WMMD714 TaxID=3016097 RepID=UPI00249A57FC|nr:superoxide dismutase [Micromonospora sp. WMMD714]WFE64822.1 superoxide dismutase [Micromonospora sp. WMMD714]
MNRRLRTALALTLTGTLLTTVAVTPAQAHPAQRLPDVIALPDGFQPEGIATAGRYAFLGSRATGAIQRVDLVTGRGSQLSPPTGTPSLGLKIDQQGRLFVAGGTTGDARVVDTRTGQVLATYPFAGAPSFVNDVVLTRDAAWFTDSYRPVLYRVPFGRHGALPAADAVTTVPLTGAYQQVPDTINLNGIADTPDGRALIVVQSNTGNLFRVDPGTGATTVVDVPGHSFVAGDGLLRDGDTLYVVQNRLQQITVVALDRAGTSGTVTGTLTDPDFDVPTTVAKALGRLYLPNARFTTTPTPTTPYAIVAVRPA